MSRKRSFEEIFDIPDDFIAKLIRHPDVASLLDRIAQEAKWDQLAPRLGLPKNITLAVSKLRRHSPPTCYLPPPFHEELYQGGWRAMDVYQEKPKQNRQAARVRLLEPWLMPILAIFEGRVIDTPESVMDATSFSTGGAVEHQVIIVGGAMFFVVELKLIANNDNTTQMFLELLSAAEMNKTCGFPDLRVYGLLTDLATFRFFSYDPSTESFFLDEEFYANLRRDFFCSDMIYVSNKIFSVIMCAYVETLRASVKMSKKKSEEGDVLAPKEGRQYSARASLSNWEKALLHAENSYMNFRKTWTNIEELTLHSSEGLKHLRMSVFWVSRLASSTSLKNPTAEELKQVAQTSVKKWHEELLAQLSESTPISLI